MSTNTTPGPWERQWSWNGFDIVADGLPIAHVHFGDDMESATANSHLISAAPDLLAALKYLLELGGDDDRRIAAEAAIAKAEAKGQAA